MDKKYIDTIKKDYVIKEKIRGHELTFFTTWGLFSPKEIDQGTMLLLKTIKLADEKKILDLGCGYGPIGITLAKANPKAQIDMVDSDFVAVQYAEKNVLSNDVKNTNIYLSNMLRDTKEANYDLIVSNIPANVGKELLHIILNDCFEKLTPNGRVVFVTIKGLREFMKRNLKEVFGNYEKLEEARGYTVSMATRN